MNSIYVLFVKDTAVNFSKFAEEMRLFKNDRFTYKLTPKIYSAFNQLFNGISLGEMGNAMKIKTLEVSGFMELPQEKDHIKEYLAWVPLPLAQKVERKCDCYCHGAPNCANNKDYEELHKGDVCIDNGKYMCVQCSSQDLATPWQVTASKRCYKLIRSAFYSEYKIAKTAFFEFIELLILYIREQLIDDSSLSNSKMIVQDFIDR